MITIVQFIVATIIICPIVVFIATYFISRKFRLNKSKAIGLAADITTGLLFISIPIAVRGLWEISIFIPILLLALVIAIIFTYIEWRTKKEIEIKPLLKKVWRIYFLLLSVSYFFVWVAGMTHSVIIFMVIS